MAGSRAEKVERLRGLLGDLEAGPKDRSADAAWIAGDGDEETAVLHIMYFSRTAQKCTSPPTLATMAFLDLVLSVLPTGFFGRHPEAFEHFVAALRWATARLATVDDVQKMILAMNLWEDLLTGEQLDEAFRVAEEAMASLEASRPPEKPLVNETKQEPPKPRASTRGMRRRRTHPPSRDRSGSPPRKRTHLPPRGRCGYPPSPKHESYARWEQPTQRESQWDEGPREHSARGHVRGQPMMPAWQECGPHAAHVERAPRREDARPPSPQHENPLMRKYLAKHGHRGITGMYDPDDPPLWASPLAEEEPAPAATPPPLTPRQQMEIYNRIVSAVSGKRVNMTETCRLCGSWFMLEKVLDDRWMLVDAVEETRGGPMVHASCAKNSPP